MFRIKAFALRNIKELSRDPLSYIFCLGFPIVMLVIMTLVNNSIPQEAGMTIYRIDNLSGGIAVFGQTFIMLFTALNVTKDRSSAFLVRMYSSPMKSADFTGGYILPMVITAVIQSIITFVISFVIALINDVDVSLSGFLLATVILIPSAVMFTGFGLLFGTLFNEKSAPGICSIIISLSSFLGSIFFPADTTGGVLLKICKALPFYYCTKSARSAIALEFSFDEFILPLIIVTLCGIAVTVISAAVFRSRMKADLS